ncbi:DUF397 domain-containing protein [Micromonospora sp. NPDC049230]|uniref:DUF397 domain-containing protein n=1 Tax=Micromonospora sp. NPDC049230 TaxID=3155502 RepID=UPI0033D823F6
MPPAADPPEGLRAGQLRADNLPGIVAVRDSKDPQGPALTFTPTAWASFVQASRTSR